MGSTSLVARGQRLLRRARLEVRVDRPYWRQHLTAPLAIDCVLDVGANVGQYAQLLRRGGYRGRIVSFEPLRDAFDGLERNAAADHAWDCQRVALGDQDGAAELRVADHNAASSFLPVTDRILEAAPEASQVATERVPMARIDSIAPGLLDGSRAVMLKMDVQGWELHVLRGAERTLEQVVAVETELNFGNLWGGGATISEVVAHLLERGFDLVALEHGLRAADDHLPLQADGIFVRR